MTKHRTRDAFLAVHGANSDNSPTDRCEESINWRKSEYVWKLHAAEQVELGLVKLFDLTGAGIYALGQ